MSLINYMLVEKVLEPTIFQVIRRFSFSSICKKPKLLTPIFYEQVSYPKFSNYYFIQR